MKQTQGAILLPATGSELAVGIIAMANPMFSLALGMVCSKSNEAATGPMASLDCLVLYGLE